MRFRNALALLVTLLASALVAQPASANVTWRGDFETGDLSQWTSKQMVAGTPPRLATVTAADMGAYGVRQGRYALKVTVKQGDDPINASGNRNELVHGGAHTYAEGDDVYLGWSTLFPTDFGRTDTWQVFTQFHHTGCCGSPPLELDVSRERISLTSQKENVFNATELWSAPLVRGVWHDFVLRVKWSTNANVGFVELWYDGAHVLPRRNVRTLFSDGRAYMKQGYYRNEAVPWTGVIFHDGMVEGTTLADVRMPVGDAGVADAAVHDAGDAQPEDARASEVVDARPPPSSDAGRAPAGDDTDDYTSPPSAVPADGDAPPSVSCAASGRVPTTMSPLALGALVLGALASRRRRRAGNIGVCLAIGAGCAPASTPGEKPADAAPAPAPAPDGAAPRVTDAPAASPLDAAAPRDAAVPADAEADARPDAATDPFGVRHVYATAASGREWYLPANAHVRSPEWDPRGSVTTTSEPGVFNVKGSPRLQVLSPSGKAWWRNIEMTGYLRLAASVAVSGAAPHWTFFARGERHSDNDVSPGEINGGVSAPAGTATWPGYPFSGASLNPHCLGSAYKGSVDIEGEVHWKKEITHTEGYTSARGAKIAMAQGAPRRAWFGHKIVVRNFDGDRKVHMETWIDAFADGRWAKISEVDDTGGWPSGEATLDGCTAAPFRYATDQLVTWAGPYATFRSDDLDYDLKWASVREIAPLP